MSRIKMLLTEEQLKSIKLSNLNNNDYDVEGEASIVRQPCSCGCKCACGYLSEAQNKNGNSQRMTTVNIDNAVNYPDILISEKIKF